MLRHLTTAFARTSGKSTARILSHRYASARSLTTGPARLSSWSRTTTAARTTVTRSVGAAWAARALHTTPGSTAQVVSDEIIAHVPKADVKKVLVVGSGGLSIGQAGEFDYSGSQAIKALRESGVKTVLVNPNIATIQTSKALADSVYFLPVTPEYLTYVLEKERPDGILLTFGGQTGLNCGIKLDEMGVLDRLDVKVLGTPIKTLITSEDRDLFAQALKEIDIPVAQSVAVSSVKDALAAAADIQYPVIVRSAFSLGGLGSGFAADPDELRTLATKSLSLSPQILVEKSMKGWKEVEYEVVRDAANNCITVCNMENFDPLGIHTGDSIVVAPSQTLSDEEYHMLRTAAIKIIRHLGVVGECNVQYALNPVSLEYKVIEVNARLSRSSALASKATGYPLAFVAAKIALGHTLPELRNAVTKTTTACFEPSLDYIVTKIPRWDLSKFNHVARDIGSSMKSVGEVMAIGRTFEESLQKAIRQVDPAFSGFQALPVEGDLDAFLQNPTDRRLFGIGTAMLERGYTVDQVHDLTKVDKWFLYKLDNLRRINTDLSQRALTDLTPDLLRHAKQAGFSDLQIAQLTNTSEDAVRQHRQSQGIHPWVKRIDTLAAEFPAHTNYLYTTYNASSHDIDFTDKGTMVLGSGVYRIGSSVEFDWCGVSCIRALRQLGKKTVMVNYNPETVSTDFDECDRLYFEELSYERVKDIYELENAQGVVVSVGGQLPQNIALRLHENQVNVLGTSPVMIDQAENRYKFSQILDRIGVDQPEWKELSSKEEAKAFAERVGYPVLVRPSYVLSGAAMNVAYDPEMLDQHLSLAVNVSPLHPVVVTKFISPAQEIDIDAVAHKGQVLCHAVSEHVEQAGVHSGDATLVLPSRTLEDTIYHQLKVITDKVAKAFEITGPFNMQVIKQTDANGQHVLKVIECNLRASRSFPFVSKVLGLNFIDVATHALCDTKVPEPVDLMSKSYPFQAVKVPQFSWTRLAGADPFLGVEMASTGEVACFGRNKQEAYLTALQSTTQFRLPQSGVLIGADQLTSTDDVAYVAKILHHDLGFPLFVDRPEIAKLFDAAGVPCQVVDFPYDDKRALFRIVKDLQIDFVINLAKTRPNDIHDPNYRMRRSAVDFGIPLVNDAECAKLFAEAMAQYKQQRAALTTATSATGGKTVQQLPSEVLSWEDYHHTM
ncbi:carbamoyl-phosphate synthase (glutamine-hydrolyzing) cpa2 [Dimargaris verticillata]|uniref:Carbamoyl phosphate synthase arginine-specific large chain n=1 Tax=Dimargaris verticillata TaxID=2761393 RepID=A0A9W8B4C7_9FUNG|nr:carbamoyl-phosphate synthase (glutamine-hydrolyzing) cpa2 [Dimargaris verticillata]